MCPARLMTTIPRTSFVNLVVILSCQMATSLGIYTYIIRQKLGCDEQIWVPIHCNNSSSTRNSPFSQNLSHTL